MSLRGISLDSVFLLAMLLIGTVPRIAVPDALIPQPEPVGFGEGENPFGQADPRTGAMIYTYRFDLPPARGLSGPTLSLGYNSSSADREAGYGWGLDLPVIERKPLSGLSQFAPDGTPLGEERYAFDGQPLVKVCQVDDGCPDEPSTQGHPAWAKGWWYYRLQVEGLFARFYRSDDRETWRVVFKGGEVLEFGTPLSDLGPVNVPKAIEKKLAGTIRWWPVLRRDPFHPNNVIAYRWQTFGANLRLYLTDIYYTPAIGAPGLLKSFAHHVQLNWAPHPFPIGGHAGPERAPRSMRLERVTVASQPWSGEGQREIYRTYHLQYYAPRGTTTYDPAADAPLWHHSFLQAISLEGHCPERLEMIDGIGIDAPSLMNKGPSECKRMPPVRFEYEPGRQQWFLADISSIQEGPPGADAAFAVLPNPEAAAIVDFDRDGLPDVVQGWPGPQSPHACRGIVWLRSQGKNKEPELWCTFGHQTGRDFPIRSARPILGYLNRGTTSTTSYRLRYQCMDAGPFEFGTVLHHNADKAPAFFNGGAPLAQGAFGIGIGVWGLNAYHTIVARPLELPQFKQGKEPPNFALGGCHFDKQFDKDAFYPRWRWEAHDDSGWMRHAIQNAVIDDMPGFIIDVNGDGFPDKIHKVDSEATEATLDFDHARVAFTRQYSGREAVPYPLADGPAVVPFVDDPRTGAASLIPSGRDPLTYTFYADINGDGLVDLASVNFRNNGGDISVKDEGGEIRVRTGDGSGAFGCGAGDFQPCNFERGANTSWYGATVLSARKPWDPNGAPYGAPFFMHDVTGDGLADIIRYNGYIPGSKDRTVEVWINLDGQRFDCVGTASKNPCEVGVVQDNLHPDKTVGFYARTAFADMNADGVDDIVVLGAQGVFVGSLFQQTPVSALGPRAPRPGLLVKIDNGVGAMTELKYRSIQELDREAENNGHPWAQHSPIVSSAVTGIRVRDTAAAAGKPLDAPYDLERKVEYTYKEPAYDAWKRQLMGFRKIATRMGDETAVTETTYWFGPCENGTVPIRHLDGSLAPRTCPQGSEDEFASAPTYKAWVGKPVRIDRYVPDGQARGQGYLWSRYLEYEPPITLFRTMERQVTFTYPRRVDTHFYRAEQPVAAGSRHNVIAGGDSLEEPPYQGGAKHVQQFALLDSNGTLLEQRDTGDHEGGDIERIDLYSDELWPHAPTVMCDPNWRCLPTYARTAEQSPSGGMTLKRLTKFIYDGPTGRLARLESRLDTSHRLDRSHESGGALSTTAPGQAHAGWKVLAQHEYDAVTGALTKIEGPGLKGSPTRACTQLSYDSSYGEFPTTVQAFRAGCGSAAPLKTELAFDRGFGAVIRQMAPDGARSEVKLDPFGRPTALYGPEPDGTGLTEIATVHFVDRSPLSYIDTRLITTEKGASLRSVSVLNGLLEPVLTFEQGENADWIVSGWSERNTAGDLAQWRRPFRVADDPITVATNAKALTVPSGTGFFGLEYDFFGRVFQERENGFLVSETAFYPLVIETRDEEQISGEHKQSYRRSEFTGRGQLRRESTMTSDGEIGTTYSYDIFSQPVSIQRTGAKGNLLYERSLGYDSLGRLLLNMEPNTSRNGKAWRYAWNDENRLVGTSDARGCGENFYYDGLGRMVGQDYSPCLASQAPYTPPNPATGQGLEVVNRYDAYESDQIAPEPGFDDQANFPIGRLTATQDRGAYTRFNFDNRGRIRRVARRVAKPNGVVPKSAGIYDAHWYTSRRDFDFANRLIRRTTGLDRSTTASEENYQYSPRGLLQAIVSSYGPILRAINYEDDGQVQNVTFADRAPTELAFHYDARRRLAGYEATRMAPSLWSAASTLLYSQPDSSTTQTELFKYHFAFDGVGNPKLIEDLANPAQWPDFIAPVRQRSYRYDDLYRVRDVQYRYATPTGVGPQGHPFEHEVANGDTRPVPLQTQIQTRVAEQAFEYDELGNLTRTQDDKGMRYDRSLQAVTYGSATQGPNQMQAAAGISARHDAAGNLVELKVERTGKCESGSASNCAQWFAYDWDEVGQLARARRWDFSAALPGLRVGTLPASGPTWDLRYAYSDGLRVLKSAKDNAGVDHHTLEVFDTLRVERATFDASAEEYKVAKSHLHAYVGGVGHVFFDEGTILPGPLKTRMFLHIPDELGSTAVVIDRDTSELVERTTYQAYGAVESDYRPTRWNSFREYYKFTGKEDDVEVGLTYFGARYYQPHLGRWISADPFTIHGLKEYLNPYAYVGGQPSIMVDPNGLEAIMTMPEDHITGSRSPSLPNPPASPSAPQQPMPVPGNLPDALNSLLAINPLVKQTVDAIADPIGTVNNYYEDLQFAATPLAYVVGAVAPVAWGGEVNKDRLTRVATHAVAFAIGAGIGAGIAAAEARTAMAKTPASAATTEVCVGPNCECFEAGTPVMTPNGKRAIETIRPNDVVISRDEVTGKMSKQRVARTFVTPDAEVVEVRLETTLGADRVVATPKHPFFVEGRGWIGAADLRPGMHILTAHSGSVAAVLGVGALPERRTVYNFEVESAHTYFVGRLASWVHNACFLIYQRSHYGGAATKGPAGRAIRNAANGQLCPGCDQPMLPGTNTQAVPEHSPSLVRYDYLYGGRYLTPDEARAYAKSSEALDGALCRGCQARQGAEESRFSREIRRLHKWFVGDHE